MKMRTTRTIPTRPEMAPLRTRPEYPTVAVDPRGNVIVAMNPRYFFTDPWFPAMIGKAIRANAWRAAAETEEQQKEARAILCLLVFDVMMTAWERGYLMEMSDELLEQAGPMTFGRLV